MALSASLHWPWGRRPRSVAWRWSAEIAALVIPALALRPRLLVCDELDASKRRDDQQRKCEGAEDL